MSDVTVRLSFPARAEYLILGRLALAGIARGVPIEDEVLADLKLAITEACGNVVRHAYDDEAVGPVRVTIEVRGSEIEITVEDDGVGLPTTDGRGRVDGRDANDGESGMGLAIIGAIADELEVGRAGPTGGTLLAFRKTL